ncbi:hypothetical protein [Tabrizicola sp. M-4]|uniref:hypothetical protein n=1 Tax=Tabrizicola sp. M-4 TaxID=3055847 RepID=UPI003DA94767
MAEEWGPWIEHDGKGCPVVGLYVRIGTETGFEIEGVPSEKCAAPAAGEVSAWIWSTLPQREAFLRVVRYRIRRPLALRRLIDLAADHQKGLPPRFPVEELA